MKTKITLYRLAFVSSILLIIIISYSHLEVNMKVLLSMILVVLIPLWIIFIIIERIEEKKDIQPNDDELSNLIKYKAGYYAYRISLFIWWWIMMAYAIFPKLIKEMGNSVILFGLALSAIIGYVSRMIIIKRINDK